MSRWFTRAVVTLTRGFGASLTVVATTLPLACVSHTSAYHRGGTAPTTTPHVGTRLILVGDAGHSTPDSPVLLAVTRRASLAPEKTLVVYLGDNIYPAGLPEPSATDYPLAARHLQAQIDAVRASGARAVFVPGNHDWDNSGSDGWRAIQRQSAFISERSVGQMRLHPDGGEPGPECEDFGDLRLVFLDTQWWLHAYEKPHTEDVAREATVLAALRRCLTTSQGREVVVFAHHPLQTHGPHGGFATWRDHLFPLTRLVKWLYLPFPLLGSGYVWARDLGVTNQDLAGSKNQHMVEQLERVLTQSPPLVFAAGHEHTLQVATGLRGSRFHVVSGSGSELSDVGDGPDTLFAQSAPGFVELEVTAAGRVVSTVHSQNDAGTVQPTWRFVMR